MDIIPNIKVNNYKKLQDVISWSFSYIIRNIKPDVVLYGENFDDDMVENSIKAKKMRIC